MASFLQKYKIKLAMIAAEDNLDVIWNYSFSIIQKCLLIKLRESDPQ